MADAWCTLPAMGCSSRRGFPAHTRFTTGICRTVSRPSGGARATVSSSRPRVEYHISRPPRARTSALPLVLGVAKCCSSFIDAISHERLARQVACALDLARSWRGPWRIVRGRVALGGALS